MQLAARVLRVSESGYYEWRSRAPSVRAVRHVWLTEQIQTVHLPSRSIYGSRRVHAELTHRGNAADAECKAARRRTVDRPGPDPLLGDVVP